MDSKEFFHCCKFYYSNITFEEAYEMTGKSVCITVSASRAYAGLGVQRLLLNHISTPHVTLSSPVAASCSLPGAMKPTKLMMKNTNGEQVPFEVDGVE
jgi:predicted acylesterase/phospholipase RssA